MTLDSNAKFSCELEEMEARDPEPGKAIAFLKAMEFGTLTRRVATHFGIEDADAIAPAPDPAQPALPAPGDATPIKQAPLAVAKSMTIAQPAKGGVGVVMDRDKLLKPIDHDAYEAVTTLARLDHWIARAYAEGIVCVDTETTSLDAMQAKLCGVSLAVAPNEACYIPCGHTSGTGLDLGRRRQDRTASRRCGAETPEAAAGRR